jgi:hypothetical protein
VLEGGVQRGRRSGVSRVAASGAAAAQPGLLAQLAQRARHDVLEPCLFAVSLGRRPLVVLVLVAQQQEFHARVAHSVNDHARGVRPLLA